MTQLVFGFARPPGKRRLRTRSPEGWRQLKQLELFNTRARPRPRAMHHRTKGYPRESLASFLTPEQCPPLPRRIGC